MNNGKAITTEVVLDHLVLDLALTSQNLHAKKKEGLKKAKLIQKLQR
jgi:hypothetical protein